MTTVVSIDLGASSGRCMLITLEGGALHMRETHRFENEGIAVGGRLYWDILYLYRQVVTGLQACFAQCPDISSIGIDTWGVDFGLLDSGGELLGNPYHYRDRQAQGMPAEADALFGKGGLFRRTGVQDMWYNTVYQLLGMQKRGAPGLASANKLLFMPDLLGYFLTGAVSGEYTTATTTQLYRVGERAWDWEIIDRLGLRRSLFPPVLPTGAEKGRLRGELCERFGCGPVPVIATAQHDSASAALAVPAQGRDYLFINSGTWSIIGVVGDSPIITDEVFRMGLSNEGAAFGRVKLVKTIMGMWLLQECRRCWRREGRDISFAYLDAESEKAAAFPSIVDCDSPLFISPDHMPTAIGDFCRQTGQRAPETQGEYMRCISQSLAALYRQAIGEIERAVGKRYPAVHLLGGAARDRGLCRLVADATGKPVIAGPVEATALGNAFVQLSAIGAVAENMAFADLTLDAQGTDTYTPHMK